MFATDTAPIESLFYFGDDIDLEDHIECLAVRQLGLFKSPDKLFIGDDMHAVLINNCISRGHTIFPHHNLVAFVTGAGPLQIVVRYDLPPRFCFVGTAIEFNKLLHEHVDLAFENTVFSKTVEEYRDE